MDDFSRNLVDLLSVRAGETESSFVGDTEPYGLPDRLYGGHFVAQALSAGFQTVQDDMLAHSLHAYFHKKGDNRAVPIQYEVITLRQGKSFASRHITASQHGETVFSMSASFKTRDEDEFFQPEMPEVKSPEQCRIEREAKGIESGGGPPGAGGRVEIETASNLFFSEEELAAAGEERSPQVRVWRRYPSETNLSQRDNQLILAFHSDGPLPFCSVIRHGLPFGTHQHMSLDHSVWFHQDSDATDWVLLDSESVATADGRGLNDCRVFNRAGTLVASVRQESLMRRLEE